MNLIAPQPIITSRAADEIRAAILDGSLAPGARVRQEELAAKLGISREPVRKALLVLEHEGLVSNIVNRGAVVTPVDPAFINEIYEFREAVESYVAAIIARRSDFNAKPLHRIIAQGRNAVRAGVLHRLIDLDWAFHDALYRASGNRVAVEVMHTQWTHIRRAMMMTLKARDYRNRVWDEHEAILEAIVERNVAQAQQLAAAHLREARAFLAAGLQASMPAIQQEFK